MIVVASGSATEPMKEGTDSAQVLKETSLWTRLCDEVRTCAHPNKFVPRLGPSVIICAGPNLNAQVLGMVLDLHLPEDWDMGADPF